MKKILWIYLLVLSFSYLVSEPSISVELVEDKPFVEIELEEIILEYIDIDNDLEVNVKPTADSKKINYPQIKEKTKRNAYEKAKYNSIFPANPYWYMQEEFTQEKKKKIKTGEIGIKYDNEISQESFEQSRTLYYEFQRDKFLLNAAYENNTLNFIKQDKIGSLSLSPEYKLSDNLSLKYVYSTHYNKQNTDLIFSIKPFKQENIIFDLGATRVYYNDNSTPKQQLIFSTEFEF